MKKPMLLSNDEFDLDKIDYTNMYISVKRDGVRAEVSNKGLIGRSFKKFRNLKLQEFFRPVYENLPQGVTIDAEIYARNLPCREIAGICNSDNKEIPGNMILYLFGLYHWKAPFMNRIVMLNDLVDNMAGDKYKFVEQHEVKSAKEAQAFFDNVIKDGYEGAVLMDGLKKYKEGRVTINEGIGYKMKPFREDDLKIVGVTERMENLNESLINELGHSYKRNTVNAKKGTGIAATFICCMNRVTTKVTINGSERERRAIWDKRETYIGRMAVVKSMDYGIKNRLRHPVLIKVKEECEK